LTATLERVEPEREEAYREQRGGISPVSTSGALRSLREKKKGGPTAEAIRKRQELDARVGEIFQRLMATNYSRLGMSALPGGEAEIACDIEQWLSRELQQLGQQDGTARANAIREEVDRPREQWSQGLEGLVNRFMDFLVSFD
jgi:hypothetical protein